MLHTFNPVGPAARRRAAKTWRRTAGGAHGWGDGWAGKGRCVAGGKDVHPAPGVAGAPPAYVVGGTPPGGPPGVAGAPPAYVVGGTPPGGPPGIGAQAHPHPTSTHVHRGCRASPRCATRTPEDGILRPHCKRFGVAVAAVLLISFAKRPASLPKGLAQRHVVSRAIREMPA